MIRRCAIQGCDKHGEVKYFLIVKDIDTRIVIAVRMCWTHADDMDCGYSMRRAVQTDLQRTALNMANAVTRRKGVQSEWKKSNVYIRV